MLRMSKNTFCTSCNFKELRVAKRAHISTSALYAPIPIFEAHGPNRYLRARKDLEPVQRKLFRDVILSLMRITASPIVPASSFGIADAADAALLDVRREIRIFKTGRPRRAIVLVVPAAAAPYRASGFVH